MCSGHGALSSGSPQPRHCSFANGTSFLANAFRKTPFQRRACAGRRAVLLPGPFLRPPAARPITCETSAYRSVEEPPCFNRLGLHPRHCRCPSPICVTVCFCVHSCVCGAVAIFPPRACALVSVRGIRRLVCRYMHRICSLACTRTPWNGVGVLIPYAGTIACRRIW
jgi:hypothetical protein